MGLLDDPEFELNPEEILMKQKQNRAIHDEAIRNIQQYKQKVEEERIERRKAFVAEAEAHGISEQQLEFLEKHFKPMSYEPWDGRVGSD